MKKPILWVVLIIIFYPSFAGSSETSVFTHKHFLYTMDYPSTWHVRELNKIASFYAPLDSPKDKFAENVSVVVEDLSRVEEDVQLIDYHRKGMASAKNSLRDFRVLEEAKTDFKGHEAIAVLYTMTDRGVAFKIRSLTFFVDKDAYVLTYSAMQADYDKYFKAAESCIRSIRVSP